ncbi:MAG: prepilin-type N-terminal cleavage/methylation domain-containing protein [Phycisphaerae bacterium]|nr:prepilin-type N-terminal cleavage/methylation domain-containing protein [Phycisphaerae bacterium]
MIRATGGPPGRPLNGKARNGKLGRCTTSRGFTLIEVLATLLLMAIVIPAAMEGITLAVSASSSAQHRSEASGLAEEKLNELLATGDWQSGSLSGNFDGDFAGYHWVATVTPWDQDISGQNIQEIDLTVSWTTHNRTESVALSTLTYVRATS